MDKLEKILGQQLKLLPENFESEDILFYGSNETKICNLGRIMIPKKQSNIPHIQKLWGVNFDNELYFFPQNQVIKELIPHMFEVLKDEKNRITLPKKKFIEYKEINNENLNGKYIGLGNHFKFSNKQD